MKTALITGITGQDGAYLAEYLLGIGYHVDGAFRRASTPNVWRLKELGLFSQERFQLIEFDLMDLSNCIRVLEQTKPNEVYNLAAQSFVSVSFVQPVATSQITGLGALNLLEAIRIVNPRIRFYQASSSEMFGKVQQVPQTELTPFYPRSPYAVAKLYAHWMTVNYRESHGLFATSVILFNHESPLRSLEFVTRKITDSIAKIKLGKLDVLELGNLDARRDWGFAREYVAGMWQMLQLDQPGNFVLATGRTVSVREFLTLAGAAVGFDLRFEGSGETETGRDRATGRVIVKVNPKFYRPAEVDALIGDASKARRELGWTAATDVEALCRMMVEADIRRNERGTTF